MRKREFCCTATRGRMSRRRRERKQLGVDRSAQALIFFLFQIFVLLAQSIMSANATAATVPCAEFVFILLCILVAIVCFVVAGVFFAGAIASLQSCGGNQYGSSSGCQASGLQIFRAELWKQANI